MAYDEGLVIRIEELLGHLPGIETRKMFGGFGFLINGNMVCGIVDESLMARVGPDAYEAALEEEHVREFDFTGRPMRGWVAVEPGGHADDDALERWVTASLDFAGTLPPK